MSKVRIDELNPTNNPQRDHVFPAMRDGIPVKLRVDQIVGLTQPGDIAGLGTAASQDVGTAIGDVVQLEDDGDENPRLPALDGSQLTGFKGLQSLELEAADLLFASGANTLARLPKGAALQYLRMNAAGDNVEWDNGLQYIPPARYTPVFTGFGTVTTHDIMSVLIGRVLFVWGRFVCGTTTATEARMSLGVGGVEGGLAIHADLTNLNLVGNARRSLNVAGAHDIYGTAGHGYVRFGLMSGSSDGMTVRTGSVLFTSGNTVGVNFSVPLAG